MLIGDAMDFLTPWTGHGLDFDARSRSIAVSGRAFPDAVVGLTGEEGADGAVSGWYVRITLSTAKLRSSFGDLESLMNDSATGSSSGVAIRDLGTWIVMGSRGETASCLGVIGPLEET